jgi:hypothetical protein
LSFEIDAPEKTKLATSRPPARATWSTPSPLRCAFAVRYSGGKRLREADEILATIPFRRIVKHLRSARHRVMKTAFCRAPPGTW